MGGCLVGSGDYGSSFDPEDLANLKMVISFSSKVEKLSFSPLRLDAACFRVESSPPLLRQRRKLIASFEDLSIVGWLERCWIPSPYHNTVLDDRASGDRRDHKDVGDRHPVLQGVGKCQLVLVDEGLELLWRSSPRQLGEPDNSDIIAQSFIERLLQSGNLPLAVWSP